MEFNVFPVGSTTMDHKAVMQGTVFLPTENPQQGSPPPNNVIVNASMEESFDNTTTTTANTKESPSINNQSNKSDSGIYSSIDQSAGCDSDNRSDCSSPERKYFCPICNKMLSSQHKFTLHIRSHNNETEADQGGSFVCKICQKVLSSSSSLDRHVLVHSGERPFHCKYCGDTFTTNGNMHRHMRTHSSKGENYESDGSTDSGTSGKSSSIEFNNNKVDSKHGIKRKLDTNKEGCNNNNNKRLAVEQQDTSKYHQQFKCPVCQRNDFQSVDILEAHLEDNHPEYPAKCGLCHQIFPNNKLLAIHKERLHSTSKQQAIVGFGDLTFLDFSSEKFPHIARRMCEIYKHESTGTMKFQCKKCSKGFPCSNSLDIHQKACCCSNLEQSSIPPGLNLTIAGNKIDDMVQADLFSALSLQKNHKEVPSKLQEQLAKVMDSSKDLADIQSILSNIKMPRLQQQQQQQPPAEVKLPATTSSIEAKATEHEEESQDSFAIEFRKMKLRGEFPCRLCTAVFPNLRALKGHNRAHLSGNTNGTYYCNMCPHSSIDKAALIRHMRTHNGDRPYECSLCNYAFTTKANCERHLRNRHSKTTREDVKKSIIYHPSEDPTNDDLNKLAMKDDGVGVTIKKQQNNLSSSAESTLADVSPEKLHCSTPKLNNVSEVTFTPPTLPLPPPKMFDFLRNDNIKALKESRFLPQFFGPPYLAANNTIPHNTTAGAANNNNNNTTPSKIQVKPFEVLRESYSNQSEDEYYEEEDEEEEIEQHPMDVALDLSKKKVDEDKRRVQEEQPQDLTKKAEQLPRTLPIFAQQLLNPHPKIDAAATAFYASHLASLCYRNPIPGWPGFPVNPLLYQTMQQHRTAPQDLKERMQRFQLCGGGSMISEELKPQPYPAAPQHNQPTIEEPEDKSLTVNVDNFNDAPKMHSPHHKGDHLTSPNSVKMVIKNGVLMPKQKQRRYRTERPFTCEHCSARFTLRSNMERHIKQQHPQFWSQRQRGTIGQPGRKPQGLLLKPTYDVNNYDISFQDETKEQINEKLRYALLAQQLRVNNQYANQETKKEAEEDEDCELVIDENDHNKTEEGNTHQNDFERSQILQAKLKELQRGARSEEDLVPVSRLLDNASQQQFKEYFKREGEEHDVGVASEEDEEGLVASGSTSEGNISGTDENRSESETINNVTPVKKKSAYSLAPNRVSCPYCSRKFPWTSSLRRHILTHTGQKPFKCSHCPLLFTTKSNCDRHLLRKHGNSATTIVTNEAASTNNNNNANYLMRNVPERPFKCSNCPSSTFSTYSNLKKHISCKHSTNAQGDDIKAQGYEAGSSEDEKIITQTETSKNDWESQIAFSKFHVTPNPEQVHPPQVPNSDLPFKCHLCESSFAERHQALDHIRDKHASEYDLLMSKNALDANATTPDEAPLHHEEDDGGDIRGKFPDYSNRKVICAWCMRRFWSAEDLRRHMRTHTGERPFSCDICRRRFTLKHSMLRHRKKHALNSNNSSNFEQSDEDGNIGEEIGAKASGKMDKTTDESDAQEGAGDLITNLLGLRDRSIIDKVLDASADDAAKLLGVKNGVRE